MITTKGIADLRMIFENQTKEQTFIYIIKMLDKDEDLTEEEKELILKICDIKNITIDEIEEYFEEQESLKTR